MAADRAAQTETEDKRAAALRATLELIAEQGLADTPMSQIAQRANFIMGKPPAAPAIETRVLGGSGLEVPALASA